MQSEPGDKASQQLSRWTANSRSRSDNGRLIANTLKMFYLYLSLSPADFYLKLHPSCLADSRWSFLLFCRLPFSQGVQSSVAKSKAAPLQSVRGYDKKPCNKGLLCNLIGPETGCSVHFNELRSPFSNHGGGGNGTLVHSPWKTHAHTHTNSVCVKTNEEYMQDVARKHSFVDIYHCN